MSWRRRGRDLLDDVSAAWVFRGRDGRRRRGAAARSPSGCDPVAPLGAQPLEHLKAKPGVDGQGGPVDPLLHRSDDVGHQQRGRGVEDDDVASAAGFAAEHRLDHAGVLVGRAAGEPGSRGDREAQLRRLDLVSLDARRSDGIEDAAVVERQLVDPVAVDDERPLRPEALGDLGHPLGGRRVADAQQLAGGPGWVRQRAEQVERGPDADLAAGRSGVLHRRMEVRREHEREPDVAQRRAGRCRVVVDADAEGVEDVGRTGLRGDGAVAVLRDRDARPPPSRARRSSRC